MIGQDLNVSLMIQRGSRWIELQNPTGGYELHKDTFASRSVTHNKVEVNSAWLEGSYTQRSTRQNVIEAVVVYVTGQSMGDVMRRINELTDAMDQNSFRMHFQVEDYSEVWACQSSDYTIETSQELMHSQHAIVRAQVPRLPKVAI